MSLLPPAAGPDKFVAIPGPPTGQLTQPGVGPQMAPSMGQAIGMPGQHQGFDLWGPLQRRKYLIALFCLIGAALGYLQFSKTPSTYRSEIKVMITTRAPTSINEGSFKLDKVSLSKHISKITSELVLNDAAENGKFSALTSFEETAYPVGALKNDMLNVISESDETLIISCVGPNAEELPIILNRIVESYMKIIAKDSDDVGQEAATMILALESKLDSEKETAELERLDLWKSLNIKSSDENGNIVNPYNKQLFYLQDQKADTRSRLAEIHEQIRKLNASMKVDPDSEAVDPINVKVAALAAQDYFKLSRADYKTKTVAEFGVDRQQHTQLTQRILALETRLFDLDLEKDERASIGLAPGHKTIIAINKKINAYRVQKRELELQVADLVNNSGNQAAVSADGETAEPDMQIDLATFRAREDREWITMYRLALQLEQDRLNSRKKLLGEELDDVAKLAGDVADNIQTLYYLQRKIDEKDKAVTAIHDHLQKLDILGSNYSKTTVETIDWPKPGHKVAPSLAKSLALGVMLAFMVGFGLAILVDQSELSFRNPQEIFDRLNVPVVGRIPRINLREIKATKGHASLIAAHKPSATASESFRDVRTALFFRANAEGIKTILFTSPSPGDGKSTTIGNLAISMAQAGKRVVLMDADFRRPRVHQYFDEELSPGLLDVLSGEKELKDALQRTELQENLFLMTSGGRPANPGELVTSEAFKDLIEALRDKFDYVLIDSPPVLPVSDPASIASMVDGVYLVTRIRKGVKLTAQKAKETLDRVGANWMGVIINGLDENPHYSEYGYQYGQYSYYGGMYGKYYDGRNQVYRDKIQKS